MLLILCLCVCVNECVYYLEIQADKVIKANIEYVYYTAIKRSVRMPSNSKTFNKTSFSLKCLRYIKLII